MLSTIESDEPDADERSYERSDAAFATAPTVPWSVRGRE